MASWMTYAFLCLAVFTVFVNTVEGGGDFFECSQDEERLCRRPNPCEVYRCYKKNYLDCKFYCRYTTNGAWSETNSYSPDGLKCKIPGTSIDGYCKSGECC